MMSRNDITNYPIQGSAFHCLLRTFIEIDKGITAGLKVGLNLVMVKR